VKIIKRKKEGFHWYNIKFGYDIQTFENMKKFWI